MPRWCHPLTYIYFTPHILHFLSDKIKPGYIISIKISQVLNFEYFLKKEKFSISFAALVYFSVQEPALCSWRYSPLIKSILAQKIDYVSTKTKTSKMYSSIRKF